MNKNQNLGDTIIYIIICNDKNVDNIYVGQTDNLKERQYNHKSTCNNSKAKNHNLDLYKFIRANNGWDNFSILPIEYNHFNNSNEAFERERYYYNLLEADLNLQVPNRSIEEYKKDKIENKEKGIGKGIINENKVKSNKLTYNCICGNDCISVNNRSRHILTVNHKKNIDLLSEELITLFENL